jgi:hypothetical protein
VLSARDSPYATIWIFQVYVVPLGAVASAPGAPGVRVWHLLPIGLTPKRPSRRASSPSGLRQVVFFGLSPIGSWHLMSRGRRPRGGRPPPEGANVAYAPRPRAPPLAWPGGHRDLDGARIAADRLGGAAHLVEELERAGRRPVPAERRSAGLHGSSAHGRRLQLLCLHLLHFRPCLAVSGDPT